MWFILHLRRFRYLKSGGSLLLVASTLSHIRFYEVRYLLRIDLACFVMTYLQCS